MEKEKDKKTQIQQTTQKNESSKKKQIRGKTDERFDKFKRKDCSDRI